MLWPTYSFADPHFTEIEGLLEIYIINIIPAILYIANIIVFLCVLFKIIVNRLLFYLIIIPNIILVMIIFWPHGMINKKETFIWFGYFPAAISIISLFIRNYLIEVSLNKQK
jgi:hypothetical protein